MADTTDKPKHKARKVIGGVIGLIILIAIIASLGNDNKPTVNTTAASTSSTASTKGSTTSKATATAKIGDAIAIGGSKGLAVTLVKVIDPASGADAYTTADAGKRFVAVDFTIKNNGTASFQDDANNDTTVIGSDNQTYNADFDSVSECTNFNGGQFTLAANESSTGCVVFQLPNGVNAAKVQFQTNSGTSGSAGEWTVQ